MENRVIKTLKREFNWATDYRVKAAMRDAIEEIEQLERRCERLHNSHDEWIERCARLLGLDSNDPDFMDILEMRIEMRHTY